MLTRAGRGESVLLPEPSCPEQEGQRPWELAEGPGEGGPGSIDPCKDAQWGFSLTPLSHIYDWPLLFVFEAGCSVQSFARIIGCWSISGRGWGWRQESVPTSYVTLGQSLPFSGSRCPQMMMSVWSLTEL